MGYCKDLGTGEVASIDPTTGYPVDDYGNLLDPMDENDTLFTDYDKPGTELYNMTSPYGFLEYAIGSGDDFLCMDYRTFHTDKGTDPGDYIILDAVRNSETGSFIERSSYEVLPINNEGQKREALERVRYVMDGAFEEVRHSRKGWNQDRWYFFRSVAHALFPEAFANIKTSDRQFRFGGKRMDKIVFALDTLTR